MHRFTRILVLCGLLSSLVLLSGCEFAHVLRVLVVDLESASVEGLQVYRVDDATGTLVEAGEYQFTGVEFVKGQEMLTFDVTTPSGAVLSSASWVDRDPDTQVATLSLVYPIELPAGWYRVAAFNSAGESEPSLEQTFF